MAYIGQAPANKAVSASDLEDGIITNAKLDTRYNFKQKQN